MTPDMKRFFATLSLLTCLAAFSFAQNASPLRPRMEIADYEVEGDATIENKLEVFYLADESPRMYYLSVGNLGVGTDIVQINFDPIFELFIPLGETLDEAVAKMEEIKDFYNQPKLATMELEGSFALAYPDNANPASITVTRRQLIFTKILEFSLPAGSEGLVRATHIPRSDFNGLLSTLKFYRRLHPDEP